MLAFPCLVPCPLGQYVSSSQRLLSVINTDARVLITGIYSDICTDEYVLLSVSVNLSEAQAYAKNPLKYLVSAFYRCKNIVDHQLYRCTKKFIVICIVLQILLNVQI